MTLKQYVLHQLREMKREVLESVSGLAPEEWTSHEPGDHSPIAWILQHCCANTDFFIHCGLTGDMAIDHDVRVLSGPRTDPEPGDPYPSGEELCERWAKVCDASIAALEEGSEECLQKPSRSMENPEPLVESCLRVINHQNAHIRQIWCFRGLRGREDKYPQQQSWLA
jgi:DinB superfamily